MRTFTVVTVCYNSEKTIARTIESILNQTYLNYEYIIIDGGSTDTTIEIIKKYQPLFKGKLKWVSEPDKGIYNAMNKGVLKSSGSVIGIVNSDDWLEKTALESIERRIENSDCDNNFLICGSIKFHYDDGRNEVWKSDKKKFLKGIPKRTYGHGAYHPAIFVSKDVYETIGLFDERFKIVGDIDFIYRCYIHSCTFLFTKDVISNMSDGGVSNSFQFSKTYNDYKIFLKKQDVKGLAYLKELTRVLLKSTIKGFIPEYLLERIRESKQNIKKEHNEYYNYC
jgi:glycosyltransferase involved in cell wall biosynthesis